MFKEGSGILLGMLSRQRVAQVMFRGCSGFRGCSWNVHGNIQDMFMDYSCSVYGVSTMIDTLEAFGPNLCLPRI